MTTEPISQTARRTAESLSWNMRAAIRHSENAEGFWSADGRTERAVEKRGLIGARLGVSGLRAWTPLGMEVRRAVLAFPLPSETD